MSLTDLLGHSGELEDVQGFIVHGSTLVDVNYHAGFSSAAEEALQVVSEFALSEGDMLLEPTRSKQLINTRFFRIQFIFINTNSNVYPSKNWMISDSL